MQSSERRLEQKRQSHRQLFCHAPRLGSKVIAARRQKIFELILPEPNRGNFEELPDYLKEGITVHFAKKFADVAKVLF